MGAFINQIARCFLSLSFLVLFGTIFGQAQSLKTQRGVANSYDQTAIDQLAKHLQQEQERVEHVIKNALATKSITKNIETNDGRISQLVDFGSDGTPLYYQSTSSPSSKVTRANVLHTNGFLEFGVYGNNMTVGVWDAGVALPTHQEYGGRVQSPDNNAEVDSHATLVTGAMIASGIKNEAKGIAFGANAISNDWRFDKLEVLEAASEGLLLSNHSYGIRTSSVPDWYFGAYIQMSRDWDEIMYHAPYYLMVTAAGNAQKSGDNALPIYGNAALGHDLLVGFNTSKNGLVVTGAHASIDGDGNIKGVNVTEYGSFGPTDDGRIKPDIAGDGSSVYSTNSFNDKSYGTSMGTSMAAPGVTASLLLLQELNNEFYGEFLKAATLKGLILHTADDVFEPGPDYKLGWGVINTKSAAQFLQHKEYSTSINEETLNQGEEFSFSVTANENEPLVVSLSWTDVAGEYFNLGELNNTTAALVNDLDIRVTQNGQEFLPWKLDPAQANSPAYRGDNLVDPFERIEINNPSGEYTITVSHKGNLTFGAQDFSLLVSGIKVGACELVSPDNFNLATANDTSARLLWDKNEDTLYEVQYKSEDDELWNTYAQWDNTIELTQLTLGKKYKARVRSICTQNLVSDFSEELEFVFQGDETVKESPLSIPDAENALVLYPNPVVNEVSVAANLSTDANYFVTDLSGNVLQSGRLQTAINVAHLPAGIYVINVSDGMRSINGKIIKK